MVRTHVKLICEEDWAFIGVMAIHSELNIKQPLLLSRGRFVFSVTTKFVNTTTPLPPVQGQHRQHDKGFSGHRLAQVEG